MASRTKNRRLYLAPESGYSTDPSSDGSGYSFVPAFTIGDLGDGLEQLPTNWMTGRVLDTPPEDGRDGATVSFEIPLIGLGTAAGDGGSPPADDWLDILLTSGFGTQHSRDGDGVDTGTTTTNLVLDGAADIYDVFDLLPVFRSTQPSSGGIRTQWAQVRADGGGGTYTVSAFAEAPDTSAIVYGSNQYTWGSAAINSSTISMCYVDDDIGTYLLTGGRPSAITITSEVGQMVRCGLEVRFDTKTEDSSNKTSLPAATIGPAITPVKGLLSPVEYGSTFYATRRVVFAANIESAVIDSTAAQQGRAGDEVITMRPTLTIEPLRTDAINDLRRDPQNNQNGVVAQLGAGVLAGGVLNTLAVGFSNAHASEVTMSDDQGHARQVLQWTASDGLSAAAAARFVNLARA